jgi:hypothetical protein
LPRCGVGRVGHVGSEHTHVRIDRPIRHVDGAVIVLIGVPRIEEKGVSEIVDGDILLMPSGGVTIRAVGFETQTDRPPRNQIFQDMAAAVIELAR